MKAYKCRVCLACYTDIQRLMNPEDKRIPKDIFADTTWFIYYEVDAGTAIDGSIQKVLKDVLSLYLDGNTIRRVLMEVSRDGYQRLDGLDILPYKFFGTSIYLEEANDLNVGLGCAFIRHKGVNMKTVLEEAKAANDGHEELVALDKAE